MFEGTFWSETRRNSDLSAEGQLAEYMDRYLYARFPTASSFSHIQRIQDIDKQLSGIDVEFTGTDGATYCVDEKAQLYYINKDLPTFAFEVLFSRGADETIGWLCNSTLKTDLYMLIWPFASQDSCKGITLDKFTKTDCLLIDKKRLLKLLADNGLTIDKMLADARKIRRSNRIGKIPISGLAGIYYYASDPKRYREAPINVIVSKSRLTGIAQCRYTVTPERVDIVKGVGPGFPAGLRKQDETPKK